MVKIEEVVRTERVAIDSYDGYKKGKSVRVIKRKGDLGSGYE